MFNRQKPPEIESSLTMTNFVIVRLDSILEVFPVKLILPKGVGNIHI